MKAWILHKRTGTVEMTLNLSQKTAKLQKVTDYGFDQNDYEIVFSLPNRKRSDFKVGMVRIDGYGGTVAITDHARKIKQKFPCYSLTVFCMYPEIFRDNPYVDEVVLATNWSKTVEAERKNFDIFYDLRYVGKVFAGEGFESAVPEGWNDKYGRWYRNFWESRNEMPKIFKTHHINLTNTSVGLPDDSIKTDLFLRSDDYITIDKSAYGVYATMMIGASPTVNKGRQTKCWETGKWNKVVEELKCRGFQVVQLGLLIDDEINGTVDLRGKTTIHQAAAIIKEAYFHFGIEGAGAHIAYAVGTPAITLFGPTHPTFFGYPGHLKVIAPGCDHCWGETNDWQVRCPRGKNCMEKITVDMVLEVVELFDCRNASEAVIRAEDEATKLILDYANYQHPMQKERIELIRDKVVGGLVLDVGAGDGYTSHLYSDNGNRRVVGVDLSHIRCKRAKQYGLSFVQADILHLPFKAGVFDTVIAAEVLEHLDSPGKGLSECERVTKQDGKLIVSLPIHQMHDAYKEHRWSVRVNNIQENMQVMELRRLHHENRLG